MRFILSIFRPRSIAVCALCAAAILACLALGPWSSPPARAQGLTPAQLRQMARSRTDSLKTVPVPDSPNFTRFVRNRAKLKILGKALFWDMQVGSDGQACASCHFHAGADNRSKNQMNPGFRNKTAGVNTNAFNDQTDPNGFGPNPNLNNFGPNYQLVAGDFPFHKLTDTEDQHSAVTSDTNDVASSMGVFNADLIATGIPQDDGHALLTGFGAVFNVGGALVRNVEPRNTPTNFNAALNHRNFWDSRARFEFNGQNPIGRLDPTARVVRLVSSAPKLQSLTVPLYSAGSQADGPPLSDLEMSFAKRNFPQVGRKILNTSLVALGQQLVATDDSVLGAYSNQTHGLGYTATSNRGIKLKYVDLIKEAFLTEWWDVPGWVVDTSTSTPKLVKSSTTTDTRFTVMEFNFPLYFGFAVNEFTKLLITDDTPFDRFMEGSDTALTEPQRRGLEVFLGQGRCINCHSGPEFTNASVSNVQKFEILERMIMGDNRVAVYDNGHYNISVRPTKEDLGVGARIGPKNLPLSNSRFFREKVEQRVKELCDPGCMDDAAIRQANQELEVPRILARPDEAAALLTRAAALLAPGNATRVAAEALIAAAEALLEPPTDLVTGSCLLAKNPALACPTHLVTLPDLTVITVQNDGALDVLADGEQDGVTLGGSLGATHFLPQSAASLLPDTVAPCSPTPCTASSLLLGPPVRPGERVADQGAHKAPHLRQLINTAPYFHNGGELTLESVVEFYNRSGNFADENINDLDVDIQPLFLSARQKADLVAFLKSLTDQRAVFEKAPFDRPSICVPLGGATMTVAFSSAFPGSTGASILKEERFELPPVGGAGGNGIGLGTSAACGTNFADFLQCPLVNSGCPVPPQ